MIDFHNDLTAFIASVANNQDSKPTGFTTLDSILSGGIRQGLYTIGGTPSIGKTSFILQIADYLQSNSYGVLYFNLEQDARQLEAKCISRKTKLPANDILVHWNDLSAEKKALVKDAIISYQTTYSTTLGNIFFYGENQRQSAEDIAQAVNTYFENFPCEDIKPVVMVDYLQLLSGRVGETDKQVLDNNVMKLKNIISYYGVPVIAISSLNRDNYTKPINLAAFKESGIIEYSSDVVIGIQYQAEKKVGKDGREVWKPKEPVYKDGVEIRKVEAVVLKNRMGELDKVNFDYYPAYNEFIEITTKKV